MSEPSHPGDDPIIFRSNNSVYPVFAFFAAFCVFALVRGYLAAGNTGERIEAVVVCGVPMCLLGWIAIWVATHRATMSISADAITFAKPVRAKTRAVGRSPILVLDRSSGSDLALVTGAGGGLKYVIGLTIPGSGTTLPMRTFDVSAVRHACLAKGWHFKG